MTIIKADEFNRVCRLGGLVQVGKPNIWATERKEEGIELNIQGKILTFSFKDGERNFDAVIQDKRILSVLGAFEKEINGETKQDPAKETKQEPKEEAKPQGSANEKKNEVHETKEENTETTKTQIICMPGTLTAGLIQKWAALPISERLIMLQNTDPSQVEERKGRAGQKYKYVSISYMIKAANMAFGFAWSVRVISWIETPTEIICNVELKAEINGQPIIKAAAGQKDIAFKKDTKDFLCKGDDYKAAQADAIKKALSLFGIAQDVYSGEL